MERLGANLNDPADPLGLNSWVRLSVGSYNTVYTRTHNHRYAKSTAK